MSLPLCSDSELEKDRKSFQLESAIDEAAFGLVLSRRPWAVSQAAAIRNLAIQPLLCKPYKPIPAPLLRAINDKRAELLTSGQAQALAAPTYEKPFRPSDCIPWALLHHFVHLPAWKGGEVVEVTIALMTDWACYGVRLFR